LERLDSGRVSYAGADLRGIPTHRRGFAMMFQDGQLFAHADVGANVGYALRLKGIGRAQRVAEVDRLLTVVGLQGYAARRPATLSGGEQQRVALARALAARPRLLLLDEPLSALDRSLRERLALDLRQVLVETGTTALLVTHDHDEAFTVADRTAIMRAGRVVQVGPTIDVWRHPADADTARFLGYDVVLDGSAAAVVLAAAGMPPAGPQRAGQPLDEKLDGKLDEKLDEKLDGKLDVKQADRSRPGVESYHAESSHVSSVALRRSAIRVTAQGPLEGVLRAVTPDRDGVRVLVQVAGVGDLPGVIDDAGDDADAGGGLPPVVGTRVRVRVDPSRVARLA
jgi:thiamine transport system ATP-binding protein